MWMTSCPFCVTFLHKRRSAKVIEFYVPENFRKPLKGSPAMQRGTIIGFCSLSKKSPSSNDSVVLNRLILRGDEAS